MKNFMKYSIPWILIVLAALGSYYLIFRFGKPFLTWAGLTFEEAKTISEIFQSAVQVFAIIIAGYWTYERFIKNREDYPYPKIEQRIEHHKLEKGVIYLSVFVTVTNEGKTKLDLGNGKVFIRQVSPLHNDIRKRIENTITKSGDEAIRLGNVKELFVDSGQRLGWITLGSRGWNQLREKLKELEPGQTREIQFDFLLINDDDVKVIEAISYFEYSKSSWELATIHSLTPNNTKRTSTQ